MTTTATPAETATPVEASSPKQHQLIADLATQLERSLEVPATRKAASALITEALREVREREGENPGPTPKQLRLLTRLAHERDKTYTVPTTRKQASARIAQILGGGKRANIPTEEQAAG